ncbi:hypothetical protein RIF29_04795 [Crotalaria pallida]|uniref:Uncharacterized protein n=1 Tax=Crotalaria pallida TaxID=3830 RepID=A0AAN9J1D0_CROPI
MEGVRVGKRRKVDLCEVSRAASYVRLPSMFRLGTGKHILKVSQHAPDLKLPAVVKVGQGRHTLGVVGRGCHVQLPCLKKLGSGKHTLRATFSNRVGSVEQFLKSSNLRIQGLFGNDSDLGVRQFVRGFELGDGSVPIAGLSGFRSASVMGKKLSKESSGINGKNSVSAEGGVYGTGHLCQKTQLSDPPLTFAKSLGCGSVVRRLKDNFDLEFVKKNTC